MNSLELTSFTCKTFLILSMNLGLDEWIEEGLLIEIPKK
jgi:hypothetical protein